MARVLSLRGGFREQARERGRKGCREGLCPSRAAEGKIKSYGDVARAQMRRKEEEEAGSGRYSCKGRKQSLESQGRVEGVGWGQARPLAQGSGPLPLQPHRWDPVEGPSADAPFTPVPCNAGSTR